MPQGTARAHGDTPEDMERYRLDQLAEYSTWVAAQDIYAGAALAYRVGDPVPTSNVVQHSYDKMGLVVPTEPAPAEKPSTKKKGEGE